MFNLFFIVNLMLGPFLFKNFEIFNEFCFLSKAAEISSAYHRI